MRSLRFPFSFSQPPKLPGCGTPRNNHRTTSQRHFSVTFAAGSAAVGVAAAAGLAVVSQNPKHPFLQNVLFPNHSSLPWGSLSLADGSTSVVESNSGVSFPPVLGNSLRLLGVGLRRKRILGLKNIDVYAFGNVFILFPSLKTYASP